MKKPVRKNAKQKPVWFHRHGDKKYPVSANALVEMFEILHDEVLISGDEHLTMFLMDMMQVFREGKSLDKKFAAIARHKWLSQLKENNNEQ